MTFTNISFSLSFSPSLNLSLSFSSSSQLMPSDSNQTRPTKLQPSTAAYPPPNLANPLPCPRCNSTTTKFCYYNNYNLSQPRYFCKSCRRYWTHGGTLRNIPIGGGTRRTSSKRHRSISSTASSSSVITMTQETDTKGSNGRFESLFGGESGGDSFLALGNGGGLDYGFGYGLEEMSDTWQIGEIEGKSCDSLIWSGLEISMQDKNRF